RCLLRAGFRPVLGVGVGAWPGAAPATPAGAFAVGVPASAVVYVMTFFVLGVAADFRYAYWCVLATIAGVVATVLARYEQIATRATAGQDSREPSPGSASAPRM